MSDTRYVDRVVLVRTDKGQHVRLMSNNGEILLSSELFAAGDWGETVAMRLAEQLDVPADLDVIDEVEE